MEFDKSKILTVVTAGQARVGQKGWFGNTITEIKENMRKIKPQKLLSIYETRLHPFEARYFSYNLFYPAQEPTYEERQAQWVKDNNVKVGTKVRVTRTFTQDEDGSSCCTHNDLVGETGVVCYIGSYALGVNASYGNGIAIPYFALEVIKEPTYAERQAEWIKKHNLKEGDKVKVLRTAKGGEDGWGNSWTTPMTDMVGNVFTYVRAREDGIKLSCGCDWPYFVLEVVKEPTYRPYSNDELNDLVGEVLTNKQSGRKKLVTGKPQHGVNLDGSYISAKDLLASFYRNTNEPCGVREEI